ncbi:MAG: twin-arginine translocase TatA/TatE family subunit [Phycisphaerales bacterium]
MAGFMQHMAFVSMPGSGEWIVILIIGLLIFGRRLPDVARSLGKSVNEFKKGMREFQDSADDAVRDVNKVTSEVVSDVQKASGVDDYGYRDPNAIPYDGGHYASPESSGTSGVTQDSAPEPTDAASSVVESSVPDTAETPTKPDVGQSPVEPMK